MAKTPMKTGSMGIGGFGAYNPPPGTSPFTGQTFDTFNPKLLGSDRARPHFTMPSRSQQIQLGPSGVQKAGSLVGGAGQTLMASAALPTPASPYLLIAGLALQATGMFISVFAGPPQPRLTEQEKIARDRYARARSIGRRRQDADQARASVTSSAQMYQRRRANSIQRENTSGRRSAMLDQGISRADAEIRSPPAARTAAVGGAATTPTVDLRAGGGGAAARFRRREGLLEGASNG